MKVPFPKADQRPRRGLWAPGPYLNGCLDCGQNFMGDKRAVQCAECAYKPIAHADHELQAVVAELCGIKCEPCACSDGRLRDATTHKHIPNYCGDLNAVMEAEKEAGLHDPANRELRVKWVACLRQVVGRRFPVNKAGCPVFSDIDLLQAPARERAEAFALTFGKEIAK